MAVLGSISNLQRDIRASLRQAQQCVTEFTNNVYEIHHPIETMVQRLETESPALDVMVGGHGRCGKSSFMNVVIGSPVLETAERPDPNERVSDNIVTTGFDIVVKKGATFALFSREGRVLSTDVDDTRQWVAEHNQRELLEAQTHEPSVTQLKIEKTVQERLEKLDHKVPYIECQPSFLHETASPVDIRIRDTRRDTPFAVDRGCGTLWDSDMFIMLIDYKRLKTSREHEIFSSLPAPNVLPQIPERFVFVVTNADEFFEHNLGIYNDHSQSVLDEDGKMPFATPDELTNYVIDMLKPRFGKVTKEQVILLYTKLALHAQIIARTEGDVPLNLLYDFCEIGYGSRFMQEIDKIEVEKLKNMALMHAREQLGSSGYEACERTLKSIATNGLHLFLLSIASTAHSMFEHFCAALDQTRPLLDQHRITAEEEKATLLHEEERTRTKLLDVQDVIMDMRKELESIIEETIEKFWAVRVADLRRLLEGATEDDFKHRQRVSVHDVVVAAEGLRTFIVTRYIRDKRHVHSKKVSNVAKVLTTEQTVDASAFIPGFRRETPPGGEESEEVAAAEVEVAAEEEVLFTSTGRQLRPGDFLAEHREAFLRAIQEQLTMKVMDLGQAFAHYLKDELELVLAALIELCETRKEELQAVFIRSASELLEATGAEAAQSSWYLQELCDGWQGVEIVTSDAREINNLIRELPYEATDLFHDVVAPSLDNTEEDDEKWMSRILDAVVAAWTSTLTAKQTFSVVSYDADSVASCLDTLRADVEKHTAEYMQRVQEGVKTSEESLATMIENQQAVQAQIEQFKLPMADLANTIVQLKESIHWDFHAMSG